MAREWTQHVMLAALFENAGVKLAFKGGTALRVLYQSPRFSEDLDFTGWCKPFHAGESIKAAVAQAGKFGLAIKTIASNQTSGGWFARIETRLHDLPVYIEWNVSLRPGKKYEGDPILVQSELYPPYLLKALPMKRMVAEKIQALLSRKKPRDFFDLYFILRGRLAVHEAIAAKKEIENVVSGLESRALERELKQFLPVSYWPVARRLPAALSQELARL
ncbi:MAG: nucleotidyl transferase AbiEii/AbiGii toxin family protein [Elusimicrobiota bacterium]